MKISFIIPVYNAAASILRTLSSVLPYLEKGCEAVVINDGSVDESQQMIVHFAQEHKGVRLINQENRGQSAARNEAIRQATGDYIWCLDADDWLTIDGMDEILATAKQDRYDVIVIGRIEEYQGYNKRTPALSRQEYPDGMDYFYNACQKDLFRTQPWNMLVRRSLISSYQVQFPEGRMFEDICWCIDVLRHAKATITLPVHPYHYQLANENSLTKQVHMRDMDMLWIIHEAARLLDESDSKVTSDSPAFLTLIYWFVSSAIMKKYTPLYNNNHGAKQIVDSMIADQLFMRSVRYAATHYIGLRKSVLAFLLLISPILYRHVLALLLKRS